MTSGVLAMPAHRQSDAVAGAAAATYKLVTGFSVSEGNTHRQRRQGCFARWVALGSARRLSNTPEMERGRPRGPGEPAGPSRGLREAE